MNALRPAGYSGKPLATKLGYRDGMVVVVTGAPPRFRETLAPLPAVRFARRPDASTDVVHAFARRRDDLAEQLGLLRKVLRADATVWVSWIVDVKVCAIDDVRSGLKLVVRKELR